MKYVLMLEDGQYHETNFALIVINARKAGILENLVVLKPNSDFHIKFDLMSEVVVIVDLRMSTGKYEKVYQLETTLYAK